MNEILEVVLGFGAVMICPLSVAVFFAAVVLTSRRGQSSEVSLAREACGGLRAPAGAMADDEWDVPLPWDEKAVA